MTEIYVTDNAVLRYLQRAHGLDIEAVRRHIASQAETGAQLGAIGVTVENVKLVLVRNADARVAITTVVKPKWPARRDGNREAE